jgi:hypothetical protein
MLCANIIFYFCTLFLTSLITRSWAKREQWTVQYLHFFSVTGANDCGFTMYTKYNLMIFLRTAYKLHSDHIEAILWKIWLIFGQIWYIYTFHISAIRFSVRSNYPLVGKNLAVVQWWWKPFSFIFNRRNRDKSQGATQVIMVSGDDNHVAFGQKFPDEKGSVKWCVVMMQQPVLLLPKLGAKSLHIFKQSP